MSHATQSWTAARVRALPDDRKRYEVVDGELLVTPTFSVPHQRMVGELLGLLYEWLRGNRAAEVLFSPSDIELDASTLVQPDVFVVPRIDGRKAVDWAEVRELLLAIEIVSPESARADRVIKRRRYQRAGIAEYWSVDLDARLVDRWQPADERPEVISEQLEWRPVERGPTLVLDWAELFTEVLDR